MKIFTISLLLIFPISISSQELDKEFIDSLPASIQSDIQRQLENKTSEEEPVYRAIQSQTKLEKSSLGDLKIRLEKDLRILEEKLNDFDDSDSSLDIFGADFFTTYQSSFMPINEPNLSSSYILDSGDVLEVQLIGQLDSIEKYTIKRDGSISIQDIGKIQLTGLSVNDASQLIKAKVNSTFIGTETFISLTNLRDINVLVSGNAFSPGVYTLSGNSNMLHAISVAGGISDTGSFREINLIRDQKVIETLDMYDILITGLYNSKITLKSGDIIFVSPVKNIISIDGAIKKPAKYELLDDQNLSKVIYYSNGLTSTADLENIYLDRIMDGKIKALPISTIKQFDSIRANDGDKIYIRKFSFRSVNVKGAILKPGIYQMSEGESVSDLISKAGGFTQNAYLLGAIYENQDALLINKMAKDVLYEEFIDNIITISQKNPTAQLGLSSVIQLTQEIKNTSSNGRVVIDLLDEVSSDSLVLKDRDSLTIPEKSDHIYIYGEVSYEGALQFDSSMTLRSYINKAGGLKTVADKNAIYILHPNGDTQRSFLRKSLFQNKPDQELKIYPGSIIFIPRILDDSASNRLATQAYVSILGNIGIALASLSSINNNN
jgi:protein involved in polysaccharide export with SLBB domain